MSIRAFSRMCVVAGAAVLPATARAEPPPEPLDELTTPLPPGGRAAPPPRLGPTRADVLAHPRDTAANLGLRRRSDGSFDYDDPGLRFRARVMTDGQVLFADRWRRPHRDDAQNGKVGGKAPGPAGRAINPFVGVAVPGPLEWILRARGQDPAGQAKAEFLARTREFRTRLAVGDVRDRVHSRLRALPGELLTMWTDAQRPWSAKRRLLFQHWDDCADLVAPRRAGPEEAADEIAMLRAEAAARARVTIEQFVRRHAPRGTARAFASRELAALNATRRTALRFDPYAETDR